MDPGGDPVDDVVKDDYLSFNDNGPHGWQARVRNDSGSEVTVAVEAVCANGKAFFAATGRAR